MRRTEEQKQAGEELAEVLVGLDLGLRIAHQRGTVATTSPDGTRVEFDVVALASPAPADVDRLVHRQVAPGKLPLLVADRLVPRVREGLSAAGWNWLDRRGHLRIKAEGLLVDAQVPPLIDERSVRVRPVLETVVGLAVASAALTAATRPKSVRYFVSFTGHSLGAVHNAFRALKDEKLVDESGLPLIPDLFWEVAAHWRPRRVPLRERPSEAPDGWALCDTLAAARHGAPAVVRGDHPPDFYVPDDRVVRICRQQFGDAASFETRGATVAVSPLWWAYARPEPVADDTWRVVHPVIAALDLSVDEGRGREILDQWEPSEPYVRVW